MAQPRKVFLWGESQQVFGFLSDEDMHRSEPIQMCGNHSDGCMNDKEESREVERDANNFEHVQFEINTHV